MIYSLSFFNRNLFTSLFLLIAMMTQPLAQAEETPTNINSNLNYFLDGKLISPWKMGVGDEINWYLELPTREGKSKGGNLDISQSTDKEKNALFLKWKGKKKDTAFFITTYNPIDLSTLKDQAGIAIDMKVDSRPKKPLSLSLDCGYPCRGSVALRKILKRYPTKKWFTLAIPLSTFADAGTDLTKVKDIIHIQGKGKAKIHIANVRLIRL